jgi:hypothetical protein
MATGSCGEVSWLRIVRHAEDGCRHPVQGCIRPTGTRALWRNTKDELPVREDRQGRCTNLSDTSFFAQGLQRGLDATWRFCILRGSSSCRLQAISDRVLRECGPSVTSPPDSRYIVLPCVFLCLAECDGQWTGVLFQSVSFAGCRLSSQHVVTVSRRDSLAVPRQYDIGLGLAGRRRRHQQILRVYSAFRTSHPEVSFGTVGIDC